MRMRSLFHLELGVDGCRHLLGLTLLVGLAALPAAAAEECDDLGTPTVYLAGVRDDFSPPTDPTVRRPAFDNEDPNRLWGDFDNPLLDHHIGHSFLGLPSQICRAVLIAHMRPLPTTVSDNDNLVVGSATRPADRQFVTFRIAMLSEAGGSWEVGSNGPTLFEIELGDVLFDDGASVLEMMEREQLLDVRVQDDTQVDYFELRVWSSPWQVRYCGRPDAYQELPPVDRAFRSPELDAAFPEATWKQPDDPAVNAFVGCSFVGLPDTLLEAELEVHMRPEDDTQIGNDGINLGLRTGPTFAFSSRIEDLPEANGTWAANMNRPTLFRFDVTDLIEDGRLDMRVQDDTTVDYARLRYRTCPPPVPCFGLTCRVDPPVLLENAMITFPLPGRIDFDVDGGDGICVNIDSMCEAPDPGWMVQMTMPGMFEGPGSTVTLADDGNRNTITVDFDDFYPDDMSVTVYDDDDRVVRHDPPAQGLAAAFPPDVCPTEVDVMPHGEGYCIRIILDRVSPIDLLQGGPSGVMGTEIRICPPIIQGLSLRPLSSVTLTGSGLDALTILPSTLIVGEEQYLARGGVRLEPADGVLRVTDIPSTGGGFDLLLDDAQATQIALGLGEMEAPAGSTVDLSVTGMLDGAPDQPLGSLELQQREDSVELVTDFSSIGSDTQTLQVWDDGVLVFEDVIPAGPAAVLPVWPDRLGKLDNQTECFVAQLPPDTELSPISAAGTAGPPVVGDELRMLAEAGPSDRIGTKSRLSVIASGGIEELRVTDAQVGRGCEPTGTRLCLQDGRLAVETAWRTPQGNAGVGTAVPLTPDTGYFWFFRESNVEMLVKALDACRGFDRLWVFAGGLTNVEVDMTVTDTWTGEVKVYKNPIGTPFQPLQDTNAFSTCDALEVADDGGTVGPPPVGEEEIFLNDGRFEVTARWQRPDGTTGIGRGIELTGDTGYFWFFNEANIELAIKVLDACTGTDHFWVFAAGLTNVAVELTVTDTQTGEVVRYSNPQGTQFRPVQDTRAFATCP